MGALPYQFQPTGVYDTGNAVLAVGTLIACILVLIVIFLWWNHRQEHHDQHDHPPKGKALDPGNDGYSLIRHAIPGGWLVVCARSGITFVPDPDHTWDRRLEQ